MDHDEEYEMRDPLTKWRDDIAKEQAAADRRKRLQAKVRQRIATSRTESMAEMERRLTAQFERRLQEQRDYFNYALDQIVAGALDSLDIKLAKLDRGLTKQDADTQRSFSDLFSQLAALSLNLRSPQSAHVSDVAERRANGGLN